MSAPLEVPRMWVRNMCRFKFAWQEKGPEKQIDIHTLPETTSLSKT